MPISFDQNYAKDRQTPLIDKEAIRTEFGYQRQNCYFEVVKVLITLRNSTGALLLCLLLSACSGAPSNEPPAPEQTNEMQTPVDVTTEPEPEPEPEPEIINLSSELLDDIVDEGVDGSISPREKLLPDLFEPTEADRKTKLRGGLLLNDEPEQIQDMLEGVEVKIEIPTG